jgi:hypothetical protein
MYEPKVAYWPQAKSLEFFFKPLLRRAYEVWRNSTQPYLLSEFAGGRMLVVTAQEGDDVYQSAFCVEEIDGLPDDLREIVDEERKKPAQGGTFTFKP